MPIFGPANLVAVVRTHARIVRLLFSHYRCDRAMDRRRFSFWEQPIRRHRTHLMRWLCRPLSNDVSSWTTMRRGLIRQKPMPSSGRVPTYARSLPANLQPSYTEISPPICCRSWRALFLQTGNDNRRRSLRAAGDSTIADSASRQRWAIVAACETRRDRRHTQGRL